MGLPERVCGEEETEGLAEKLGVRVGEFVCAPESLGAVVPLRLDRGLRLRVERRWMDGVGH